MALTGLIAILLVAATGLAIIWRMGAVSALTPPPAMLNACLAVADPEPVPLNIKFGDFTGQIFRNAQDVTWESTAGGGYILRGATVDQAANTKSKFAMEFEPVKGGATGGCMVLSRYLVDGEELPAQAMEVLAQQVAVQIIMQQQDDAAASSKPQAPSAAPPEVAKPSEAATNAPSGGTPIASDRAGPIESAGEHTADSNGDGGASPAAPSSPQPPP